MKKYSLRLTGLSVLITGLMFLSFNPYILADDGRNRSNNRKKNITQKSNISNRKTVIELPSSTNKQEKSKKFAWQRKVEQKGQFAANEVLVKLKEGTELPEALGKINLANSSFVRVYSIARPVAKFKKNYQIEKGSQGWYWFLGKQYKEVTEIPDEEIFKEAYKEMTPEEQSLYRTYKITLPKEEGVKEAVKQLKSLPEIEYAQPNYLQKPYMQPNDPFYSSRRSWGQPYDDLWGVKKIQSGKAWDISQGEGVVVAVIDTGVDYNHDDLSANIWSNPDEIPGNAIDDDNNGYDDDIRGYDFSDWDADPEDYDGHGTHVSGTIAAVGNNSKGIIGIAPKAKIMAVKIFPNAYDDVCAEAIKYAVDNGARVLSNSWGPGGRNPEPDPMLGDVIEYAHSNNCVVVFAAGNADDDVAYYSPNNHPKVITVAAFDQNDQKCDFSNYGAKIDVAAPGGGYKDNFSEDAPYNILSLLGKNYDPYYDEYKVGYKYLRLGGTSMACPHVSGLAALILAKHPGFGPEEVRQAIRASADDVDRAGWDIHSGYGRINSHKALQVGFPCSAIIYEITSDENNSGLKVTGTAGGGNFSNYNLQLINFETGNIAVKLNYYNQVNNAELGTIPLDNLVDGKYIIKLAVANQGGFEFTDRKLYQLENLKISTENYSLFGHSSIIHIEGQSKYDYSIVWGEGTNPRQWSNTGVTIGREQTTLGRLEGKKLPKDDGIITVKVTDTIGNKETVMIFLSPIKSGWPKKISDYWGIDYWFSAEDLNGDNLKEVIALDAIGNLSIFKPDGALLAHKSFEADETIFPSAIIITDLDSNGSKKIIFSHQKLGLAPDIKVYITSLLPDNTIKTDNIIDVSEIFFAASCVADDINLDGKKELIITGLARSSSEDKFLYLATVFDSSGNRVTGWPVKLTPREIDVNNISGETGMPWLPLCSVGNLDDDAELEIVAVGMAGSPEESDITSLYFTFFDPDGKPITGAPKLISKITGFGELASIASPVIGDINADHKNEVIIGTLNGLYVLDRMGNILWSKNISNSYEDGYKLIEKILLSDVDNDNVPEIICSAVNFIDSYEKDIFIYKGNGELILSRPTLHNGSVVADINQDGNLDVITLVDSKEEADEDIFFNFYIDIWNPLSGNSLQTNHALRQITYGTPLICDLEGDGTPEAIASYMPDIPVEEIAEWCPQYLCVWELDNFPKGPLTSDWPMFHHDPELTGNYPLKLGIPPNLPIVTDEGGLTKKNDRLYASWSLADNESDIAAYQYRITKDGENGAAIRDWSSTGKNNSVTASGLSLNAGSTYYFAVRAKNNAGLWSKIGYSDGITFVAPPDKPSELIVKSVNSERINLAWQDNAINETGFKIMRSLDRSSGYKQIADLKANKTSYSDEKITPEKLYYYRVKAYNGEGDSGYSNTVAAMALAAPEKLTFMPVYDNLRQPLRLYLKWEDNSKKEDGFEIERSIGGGGFATLAKTEANTTAYPISQLPKKGQVFRFRVRAYGRYGSSSYSNIIKLEPK